MYIYFKVSMDLLYNQQKQDEELTVVQIMNT